MGSRGKSWKEAASVILVGRANRTVSNKRLSSIKNRAFDYRVLLLTRNSKGSFAGAHVFPGGTLDKADYSPSWMELFGDAQMSNGLGFLTSIKGPRPPMMSIDRHTTVPNDVAFRICAIRETFEESGVLLLKKTSSRLAKQETVPYGSSLDGELDGDLLKQWRNRVHEDASQFLTLCRELNCVPDLWALAEWSNWLTPAGQPRRFDTMFYLCCMENMPDVDHDTSEMVRSQWAQLETVLQLYHKGTIRLIGPQIYELLRMARFPRLEELHAFSSQRAFLGCQQNNPVVHLMENGIISVYEGDDLHPGGRVDKGSDERPHIPETIEQSRNKCQKLNRVEMKSPRSIRVQCNIDTPCGHVAPRPLTELLETAPKL